MSLNFYLILIVILLGLIFASGILLVICRKYIVTHCCDSNDVIAPARGQMNQTFEEQVRPDMQQAPFNPMDAAESPPSYEEAVKQELFRYRTPSQTHGSSPGECHNLNDQLASPSTSENRELPTSVDSSLAQDQLSRDFPIRHRTSISGTGASSQLSIINEEEDEQWPIQVVIDCIGMQTTRLFDSAEPTTVNLENGPELTTHTKC